MQCKPLGLIAHYQRGGGLFFDTSCSWRGEGIAYFFNAGGGYSIFSHNFQNLIIVLKGLYCILPNSVNFKNMLVEVMGTKSMELQTLGLVIILPGTFIMLPDMCLHMPGNRTFPWDPACILTKHLLGVWNLSGRIPHISSHFTNSSSTSTLFEIEHINYKFCQEYSWILIVFLIVVVSYLSNKFGFCVLAIIFLLN